MLQVVYLGAPEGHEAVRGVLGARAEVRAVDTSPDAVAAALSAADALIDASMKVRITDAMVRAATRLKIVSCATTGSDHIERGELNARGVPVRTLKEDGELLLGLTPAAELSWALLMACARRLKGAFKHVDAGGWTREEFPGVMLKGRALGLIGFGRIGGWMARYATAFGMRVLASDPYQQSWPGHVEQRSLADMVPEADFVSIHVHLSDQTRGLLSRDLIARMKPGAILINTSRGALVDERALLEALESGRIAAAGLDVLEGEPDIADHPLAVYARTHDNLLITPHCGGFSPDAVRIVCARAAEKVLAAIS